MTKRIKLAVLDANYYWTEQLFSACNSFADVLLLRPRDFRAFRKQHGRLFVDLKPQQIDEHVWEQHICCPPGWLFHYWSLSERFFSRLIRQFKGNDKLVFVFCYPYYYSLTQRIESFSVYYNVDDYEDYWPGRESTTRQAELMAVGGTDLSVCVARYRANWLQKQVPARADRVVHLPHGCSPDFMIAEPLCKPEKLPIALSEYQRPVAGYIGALDYRFDYRFLYEVAEAMPDVTFILGGKKPQASDGETEWWQGVEKVRSLPNVHFIGWVSHERLGEYLQSFDVLLMIYSDCKFNINCCPMKLWDYMGTSLPVVANDVVPEVRQWRHVIKVARDTDEFAEHIRASLSTPHWMSAERLEVAKSHTWKLQAQKLQHIIEREIATPAH